MSEHRSVRRHAERANPKRKGRSLQRHRALDVLFEGDVRGMRGERLRELLTARQTIATAQQPIKSYGVEIVTAYLDNARDVDAMIDAASPAWALERMSTVDRNIVRIATAEMLYLGLERPIAVKEAASLAREFSASEAVPFVMGVLNRVADIRALETSGSGFAHVNNADFELAAPAAELESPAENSELAAAPASTPAAKPESPAAEPEAPAAKPELAAAESTPSPAENGANATENSDN